MKRALAIIALTFGCAAHIPRDELLAQIDEGEAPVILDVRSRGEYEAGHVPGAIHIPFYAIASLRDDRDIPKEQPVVVYCEHGPRAGLARAGYWLAGGGRVLFLEGHMTAWRREGLPVVKADPPARQPSSENPPAPRTEK